MNRTLCMKFLLFWTLFLLSPTLDAKEISAIRDETLESSASRYRVLQSIIPDHWPLHHTEQNCEASFVEGASEPQTIQFHFVGHGGIEYLAFETPLELQESGVMMGIRADVCSLDGQALSCPFNLRFLDPSGETHQIPFNIYADGWFIGQVQTSPSHWGGDKNGILEMPCRLESVTMDRLYDGWSADGIATVHEIAFLEKHDLEEMIQLDLGDLKPTQNLFEEKTSSRSNAIAKDEKEAKNADGTKNAENDEANGRESNDAENKDTGDAEKIERDSYHFCVIPQEKSSSAPLQICLDRQQNDALPVREIYPMTQAGLDAFSSENLSDSSDRFRLAIDEDRSTCPTGVCGHFTMEKPSEVGFESVIVSPFVETPQGRVFGQPWKYSLAVLPEQHGLNPWFGVCTHVNFPAVDRLPKAGVGMIRDDIIWAAIEKEPGRYDFPPHWDKYVDRVLELGMEPLLIILYSNPLYDNGDFPHSDEAITAYGRYAAAVAEHFRGRCRYYEIWNEWSGGCSMSPENRARGNNTPENYARLLKAASTEIRKVDPNAFLIGGGGEHHRDHLPQITKMLQLGVMNDCDAFSVHPYIYPNSPELATLKEDLQKVIDLMRENGCENPKLWLTEQGWPTYRGLIHDKDIVGSSFALEDYSANMLVRTLLTCRSIPEIERYIWYDLQNDGTNLEYNENNFGLLHNEVYGNQPKASYSALAWLMSLMTHATVQESPQWSSANRRVFVLQKEDGSTILAAWTLQGTETFELPDVQRVYGLYGNALPDDHRELSPRPVYFLLTPAPAAR